MEGTPALRDAVAAWFSGAHGFSVERSQVAVTVGAKQAVFNAFHALLSPGDEVLIPAPCWVSYADITRLAGAVPVPVHCRAENGFNLDPADVAAAVTERTKMLLIVSPCNPTGAVYGEDVLRPIADLAVSKNLWLLTDDIYRTLVYGDTTFVQPATFGEAVRERTVIVDGVSKAFAMTGWRVGFVCAPRRSSGPWR